MLSKWNNEQMLMLFLRLLGPEELDFQSWYLERTCRFTDRCLRERRGAGIPWRRPAYSLLKIGSQMSQISIAPYSRDKLSCIDLRQWLGIEDKVKVVHPDK